MPCPVEPYLKGHDRNIGDEHGMEVLGDAEVVARPSWHVTKFQEGEPCYSPSSLSYLQSLLFKLRHDFCATDYCRLLP